jgi:hypothetical protein
VFLVRHVVQVTGGAMRWYEAAGERIKLFSLSRSGAEVDGLLQG